MSVAEVETCPAAPPAVATLTWHGASFVLDVAASRLAIVEYMLTEGLSLSALADSAGISRMSLWRFMRGRQCSPSTVRRILATVHVDLKRVLQVAGLLPTLSPALHSVSVVWFQLERHVNLPGWDVAGFLSFILPPY